MKEYERGGGRQSNEPLIQKNLQIYVSGTKQLLMGGCSFYATKIYIMHFLEAARFLNAPVYFMPRW